MPEFKNDEEFEEWFRRLNLYNTDEGAESMKWDEMIKKAMKDPFYNPALRKKPKKESKPKKEFESYNWTTHKKKIAGLKTKIAELQAKMSLDESEKVTLKRLLNLLSWHKWALKLHQEGKSDKWIHNETQKRREEAKKKAGK
jgi:hypothetical protein